MHGSHTRLRFGEGKSISIMESSAMVRGPFTINRTVDGGYIAGAGLGNQFTFAGTIICGWCTSISYHVSNISDFCFGFLFKLIPILQDGQTAFFAAVDYNQVILRAVL
jgi:hypothetical protein